MMRRGKPPRHIPRPLLPPQRGSTCWHRSEPGCCQSHGWRAGEGGGGGSEQFIYWGMKRRGLGVPGGGGGGEPYGTCCFLATSKPPGKCVCRCCVAARKAGGKPLIPTPFDSRVQNTFILSRLPYLFTPPPPPFFFFLTLPYSTIVFPPGTCPVESPQLSPVNLA